MAWGILDEIGDMIRGKLDRSPAIASPTRRPVDDRDDFIGNLLKRVEASRAATKKPMSKDIGADAKDLARSLREARMRAEEEKLREQQVRTKELQGARLAGKFNRLDTAPDTMPRFTPAQQEEIAVRQWALGPGSRFLKREGLSRDDVRKLYDDPYEFISKSGSTREWLRSDAATGQLSRESREHLKKFGATDDVIGALWRYMGTETGFKNLQKERTGDPVYSITKDATGNEFLAGLASAVGNAATFSALGGLSRGTADPRDPALWGDALGAVSDKLVLGRGVNTLENQVAKRAGLNLAQKAWDGAKEELLARGAQFVGQAGARAALNVIEDVPATAAQLALYGMTPDDPMYWRVLATQAGVSGAGGAAVPALGLAGAATKRGAGDLARGADAVIGRTPDELKAGVVAGAAGYGTAKLQGKDEEEALIRAGLFGGGTAAVKALAGRTRLGEMAGLTGRDSDYMTDDQHLMATGLQSLAGAGYGFATGDGDMGDRAKNAAAYMLAPVSRRVLPDALRATSGITAQAVKGTIKSSSDLEDFRVGTKVFSSAPGSVGMLGKVTRVAEDGSVYVKDGAGKVKKFTNGQLLTEADHLNRTQAMNYRQAVSNVTPAPEVINTAERRIVDHVIAADIALRSDRNLARIADKVGLGGVVDPAVRWDTAGKRTVLRGVLASANVERAEEGISTPRVNEMLDALAPLIEERGPRLKGGPVNIGSRATLRAAGAASPLVASTGLAASGALPGDEPGIGGMQDELLIAGSLAASMGLAETNRRGVFHDRPWEAIRDLAPDPYKPKVLNSGPDKLLDIIQRPEAYDLPPEARSALDTLKQMRQENLTETNAYLRSAGMDMIPENDANTFFQWFTPESVEKALGEKPRAIGIETPKYTKTLPIQKARELGATYYEALQKHPELRIAGDIRQLLQEEAKQHARLRANATFVKSLKDSGQAWEVPDYVNLAPDAAKGLRLQEQVYRDGGWAAIPGINDHLFHPDVIDGVSKFLGNRSGTDNAALNVLDQATNFFRQAMFVGDASAWTMQGAMAFIENPAAVLRNAPHLIGATTFGKNYFDWWIKNPQNRGIWEGFTRSGGITGREFEGLEVRGKTLASLPGIRNIEERGFEAFLPIHRALMWKHVTEQNAFIRAASAKTKIPRDLTRLGVEVARYAPAVAAGAAATQLPGTDDPWENIAAAALAGAVTGIATDRLLSGAMGKVPTQTIDEVRAAKHVNRISGTINREMLGITPAQSQIERVFLFRSPALTRNTLTLMKLAFSPGEEGAMARFYLAKTAALTGVALAAVKYFSTGEWDSFDPRDEDSVFNPNGLLRVKIPGLGTLSPSNPVISLVRAATADNPLIASKNWLTARFPDNPIGAGSTLFLDQALGGGFSERDPRTAKQKWGEGDKWGAALDPNLLGRVLPVSVQGLIESGLPAETATGDAIGLDQVANPDVNHGGEAAYQALAGFAGLNVNPETLNQESTRIRSEVAQRLFGRDIETDKLNQRDRERLNLQLEGNGAYRAVSEAMDRIKDGEDPIDLYYNGIRAVTDDYSGRLLAYDQLTRAGLMSKAEFREAYNTLQNDKRLAEAATKRALGSVPSGRYGYEDMPIAEYLTRNQQPEDKAVDGWYSLYDKATVAGKLDFDRLDSLQQQYLRNLPPEQREYVIDRVNSFGGGVSPVASVAAYDRAKAVTKPYFALQDSVFAQVAPLLPSLSQFKSKAEFDRFLSDVQHRYGLPTVDDALDMFVRTAPDAKVYQRILAIHQKVMRLTNANLDAALVEWYGRAPQHPEGKINRLRSQLAPTLRSNFFAPEPTFKTDRQRESYMEELSRFIA